MRYTFHRMRILLLIFSAFPLFGAYVGNPASPGLMTTGFFSGQTPVFKFTSGYLADYTSNMRFEPVKKHSKSQVFHEFGVHSQMATVSAIFVERLELFGYAGGSKEHAKWERQLTMNDFKTVLTDFQSTYHFSWSSGCKVILLQWWQTFLSADFTYFSVPASHQSFFKFLNRLNLPMETEKQTFSINEWQTSLGLSSRIFFLTPYGGITYLSAKLNIHSGVDVPPMYYRNKDKIGYFFGLTLSLTGRFHINLERRIRDEFSYSLAATAVF
jgi:hypothetical protein